jgi:DNA invertase Pin-like site-specific DNA recombinase
MIIGYARVSTLTQNLDLQFDRLKDAGCEKIYAEKISGRSGKQQELNNLLDNIRPGDTLIVYSIDRLGRTTRQLIDLIDLFREKGIYFKSLSEGVFDTASPMSQALFQIISVLKEMEVNILRERSAHGLAAAKNKGIKLGRPKGLSDKAKEIAETVESLYLNNKPISFIMRSQGISRSQVYRYLHFRNVTLRSEFNE